MASYTLDQVSITRFPQLCHLFYSIWNRTLQNEYGLDIYRFEVQDNDGRKGSGVGALACSGGGGSSPFPFLPSLSLSSPVSFSLSSPSSVYFVSSCCLILALSLSDIRASS